MHTTPVPPIHGNQAWQTVGLAAHSSEGTPLVGVKVRVRARVRFGFGFGLVSVFRLRVRANLRVRPSTQARARVARSSRRMSCMKS